MGHMVPRRALDRPVHHLWRRVARDRGGILAEMPIWSPDSRTIYFDSHDANGNASFWAIPATGGAPKLLARFDDPTRPAYRPEWAVCGKRMYFVIQEPQSDIWVMDATPR
jgi:Tol biopolymer transport system component